MSQFSFGERKIGKDSPAFIIAEMSANHAGSLEHAMEIVHAAHEAGADCLKIQTYTADTMTLNMDKPWFRINKGTWQGYSLYKLYQEAFTPWDWQPRIKELSEKLGMKFLSTPFDKTSVDFLESMGVDAYKIASFELTDIPLIRYVASKAKPMVVSTGMGSYEEIEMAVSEIRNQGNQKICLLRCSSAYPAVPENMNLRTMAHMADAFGVPVGLSDHSMGGAAAVAAVALGASVIEKHLCLSRKIPNPDASFSMEPDEFSRMVKDIRSAERALGQVSYNIPAGELENRMFRRSIFAKRDIDAGEAFTDDNICIIRPAHGLEPRYYDQICGKAAAVSISAGTPLSVDMVRGL